MKTIVLPNILNNPVYVIGLSMPLEVVAEELDNQGKHAFASALRDASTVCTTFAEVNLYKTAKLHET